jgi:hypothetical protein
LPIEAKVEAIEQRRSSSALPNPEQQQPIEG